MYSHVFLTSAIAGELASLPWEKSPQYSLDWRLGGPQTILDDIEKRKFLPLSGLELNTSVIQPKASHYTDCAMQAPTQCNKHHLQVAIQTTTPVGVK